RREQEGVPRLLYRGTLRSGAGAGRLGSEVDPRRPRPAEGSVRHPAPGRALRDRDAREPAAHGLHARAHRSHAIEEAPPQCGGNQETHRQGGAARLHAGTPGPALQQGPREDRDRPRQGQEAARQARDREGARLAARAAAAAAQARVARAEHNARCRCLPRTMKRIPAAALAAFALPCAHAANSIASDISDMWWNSAESGWGMNATMQANILFITLYVYSADGKAHWFVAPDMTADLSNPSAP